MQKKFCESNGRAEQIQSLISKHCGGAVRLKLETAADDKTSPEPTPEKPKNIRQKKNEIINDPAVKTVLMELDATITGIEENQ